MNDKIKNIIIIVLLTLTGLGAASGIFFFVKSQHIRERETAARVEAQNQIAELSRTVKEGERTWSRLAQEKDIELSGLRERNQELSDLIDSRNEQITTLSETIANFEPVRVVVRRENVHQDTQPPAQEGEPERIRVAFDETWEDFIRVQGFTLTNPAEAELDIQWTRPAHISVAVTQAEDLSWRAYVTHDIPNLRIDNIETTVNPISRPQEEHHWYENLYVGGGVAIAGGTSTMGYGFLEAGYDFGDIEFGLLVTGIGYQNGGALGGGFAIRINPFSF